MSDETVYDSQNMSDIIYPPLSPELMNAHVQAVSHIIMTTDNPHLGKDSMILRYLEMIATRVFRINWHYMVDLIRQGTCVFDDHLHALLRSIAQDLKKTTTMTVDEQACFDRIATRSYVKSSEILKLAGILNKHTPWNRQTLQLFAVDRVTADLKTFIDHFKTDDECKNRHAQAVRQLYHKGFASDPLEMQNLIAAIYQAHETKSVEEEHLKSYHCYTSVVQEYLVDLIDQTKEGSVKNVKRTKKQDENKRMKKPKLQDSDKMKLKATGVEESESSLNLKKEKKKQKPEPAFSMLNLLSQAVEKQDKQDSSEESNL